MLIYEREAESTYRELQGSLASPWGLGGLVTVSLDGRESVPYIFLYGSLAIWGCDVFLRFLARLQRGRHHLLSGTAFLSED